MDYRYDCGSCRTDGNGVDMDKASAALVELTEGIAHCMEAPGIPNDGDGGPVLMLAAVPGSPVQVVDADWALDILPSFGLRNEVVDAPIPGLSMAYDPGQVLAFGGHRYLAGPAILFRTDGNDGYAPVTATDAYYSQIRLADMETTLCADGQDFPAFRLE